MRNKLGKGFMLIGIVLMLAALSLLSYNHIESENAEQSSQLVLPQIQDAAGKELPVEDVPVEEMTVTEIDGYGYIGYLNIPKLDLELPIMSQWDYDRLKIAPCRFTGSVKTDDLTIAAHNYASHFGSLKNLSVGDSVTFTDMDGIQHNYQVVRLEELAPTAVERVTSGISDLILFTCTYGGQSRVTVYCDRVN